MLETNNEQTEQADPQPHAAAASAPFERILQWAAVVLSVIALLLGVVANLRVSAAQDGTVSSASATSSDDAAASSGSDADDAKKVEAKTVKYVADDESALEGDYPGDDDEPGFHLKVVGLEATGYKATLTAEVTNIGPGNGSHSFWVDVFQNGIKISSQSLKIDVPGIVQEGHTITVTTDFDIDDTSQPISLEIEMTMVDIHKIEFTPQN